MLPGVAVGDWGGNEGRTALSGAAATGYARRRPELTTLHRVVRENLLTLYAAVEDGGTGASLPAFVRKELDGYVACGLLSDERAPNGRGGAVVVMQRASSDLRCNPHLHGVFLDGLFVMGPDAIPVFRALPRLSTTDAAEVLQTVRARVVRRLVRLGVLAADDDATVVDDVDVEPILSPLAAAAVAGLPPAGPEVRRGRLPIALRGKPGVTVSAPRCVEEQGFTLHANTCAGADDERGREALLQYVLRPPVANENVQDGPDGLVRIVLKRPFADGTTAIDMDPLSLLCRLATLVPPPRLHTVRYSGVLSSASTWRALVIPPPPPAPNGPTPGAPLADGKRPKTGKRSRYWRWAQLLARTFGLHPEICDRCGGPMQIVALVTEPESIARYLRHVGEPTEPPPLAPARGPPYYQSRLRRRSSSQQQAEMFDS